MSNNTYKTRAIYSKYFKRDFSNNIFNALSNPELFKDIINLINRTFYLTHNSNINRLSERVANYIIDLGSENYVYPEDKKSDNYTSSLFIRFSIINKLSMYDEITSIDEYNELELISMGRKMDIDEELIRELSNHNYFSDDVVCNFIIEALIVYYIALKYISHDTDDSNWSKESILNILLNTLNEIINKNISETNVDNYLISSDYSVRPNIKESDRVKVGNYDKITDYTSCLVYAFQLFMGYDNINGRKEINNRFRDYVNNTFGEGEITGNYKSNKEFINGLESVISDSLVYGKLKYIFSRYNYRDIINQFYTQ